MIEENAVDRPAIAVRSWSTVMRLLSPVLPPEVTHDSTKPMTMSFGRWIGWTSGDFDSTTRMSPFGRT
jgi:hypothetical protein